MDRSVIAALLWVALGAAPASALDYHDPHTGCAIRLPPGWSQLSDQETSEAVETLRQHTPGIRLRAAFRSGKGELPYMLVSELPIANASLERVAKLLGSQRMADRTRDAARILDAEIEQLGVPHIDERRKAVLLRSRTDQVLTLSAVFPGSTSAVQVTVVFAADTTEAQLAPFDAITSSFRFDEGRGYAPRSKLPNEWWLLLAVLVVGLSALHRATRRERAKPPEVEPEAPPERT